MNFSDQTADSLTSNNFDEAFCSAVDALKDSLENPEFVTTTDHVRALLQDSGLGGMEARIGVARCIHARATSWGIGDSFADLQAQILMGLGIQNSICEAAVNTIARKIPSFVGQLKEDHNKSELLQIVGAVSTFYGCYNNPFSIGYLNDILHLEDEKTFSMALKVAPILLGNNQYAGGEVSLVETIDALFSRRDFEGFSPVRKRRLVKELIDSMPISYWAENMTYLEEQQHSHPVNWKPRTAFMNVAFLDDTPLLCLFPIHDEDRTYLALPEGFLQRIKSGEPSTEAVKNSGVALKESGIETSLFEQNPVEEQLFNAIGATSKWREKNVNAEVIDLASFRQNQRGHRK